MHNKLLRKLEGDALRTIKRKTETNNAAGRTDSPPKILHRVSEVKLLLSTSSIRSRPACAIPSPHTSCIKPTFTERKSQPRRWPCSPAPSAKLLTARRFPSPTPLCSSSPCSRPFAACLNCCCHGWFAAAGESRAPPAPAAKSARSASGTSPQTGSSVGSRSVDTASMRSASRRGWGIAGRALSAGRPCAAGAEGNSATAQDGCCGFWWGACVDGWTSTSILTSHRCSAMILKLFSIESGFAASCGGWEITFHV